MATTEADLSLVVDLGCQRPTRRRILDQMMSNFRNALEGKSRDDTNLHEVDDETDHQAEKQMEVET